jgi:hypothetical protein
MYNTISKYCCEFESRPWRGVLDTILCDKVHQWLAAGRWFSAGTPVSSTDKTYRHDMTEILLKVALNTIIPIPNHLVLLSLILFWRYLFVIYYFINCKYFIRRKGEKRQCQVGWALIFPEITNHNGVIYLDVGCGFHIFSRGV